jgi:predicted ThiF/HesA family dinucleotide-utilizing enzyme
MARHSSLSVIAAVCAAFSAACASVQGVRSEPLDAGEVHFYVASFGDVVVATRATVQTLEITVQDTATIDSTTWMVLGTKGLSMMSYGEVVRVIVHQTADGPVAVRVVSKRRMATNVFARNWSDSIFAQLDAILAHPQS